MLKHSVIMSYLPVRIMLKNSKKFQRANVLGTCVHAAISHDKSWFPVLYIDLLFSEESRLVD